MAAAARSLLQRGAVAGGMFAATRTISTISSWKAQYLLNSNAVATATATTTTCMRPWAVTLGFRSARLLGAASIAHFPRLAVQARGFSAVKSESSLNDPSPNWSNRPPKETILLDGCDFEHWLIVMEPPQGDPTRDEIIDSYIKTLAQIVGSEEEARMKIYSVSTRHYYAFGCLISEELSYKLKPLPNVRWVLPDSYLDPRTKDYGGEPFINGQAVPYDPKYHEEWVRNNAKCNESRSRDRPRNFDRSRNFERRREMQQQARQNYQRPPPSQPGYPGPPPPSQPGFSNQPPSQPGFSNQPPTQPGFSNQPPSQPGFSNQPPSQPGYPAPPPPSQPGFPNQPPSQPGYQSTPSPQSGYGNPPSHSGYSNPPHNPSAYGNPPPSQPGYSSPTGNPSGYYDYQGQQR